MNNEELKEWVREQIEVNFRDSAALLAFSLLLMEREGIKQDDEAL